MLFEIMLILGAFSVGLIAGVALARSALDDTRNLLAHLLDDPDDEALRALVRATLYQEER